MSERSYIDKFLENYKNYKEYWNYEDGCVLMGCQQLYKATGEKNILTLLLIISIV